MADEERKIPRWLRFFRERVPINIEIFEELSKEPIPNHMRTWWYCLGGTPFLLFGVQIVTGVLLAFYYVPSTDGAWESVRAINTEIPFGWWVRSVHHWAANLMIIAVLLHLIRVFITGAYRKPRELNWVVGAGLLFVTLGFAYTGYALVYDQLSYWAATVGINITESFPLVGPLAASVLRGGPEVGPNTLTRFFVFHIGGMPVAMTLLLGFHILLLRIHGVMEIDAPPEVQETPVTVEEDKAGKRRFDPNRFFAFFPDHVATELIVGLFLCTALALLAVIFPVGLGEPANPAETPLHIKPEWYFFPVFRWLKITPFALGIGGLIAAGLAFVLWPFIDGAWRRFRPKSEIGLFVGLAAFTLAVLFLVWEVLA